MSLPIDLTGQQGIVNGDFGIWGGKVNNVQQILADGINELYEDILNFGNGIDGGSASSTYLSIQNITGGNA